MLPEVEAGGEGHGAAVAALQRLVRLLAAVVGVRHQLLLRARKFEVCTGGIRWNDTFVIGRNCAWCQIRIARVCAFVMIFGPASSPSFVATGKCPPNTNSEVVEIQSA